MMTHASSCISRSDKFCMSSQARCISHISTPLLNGSSCRRLNCMCFLKFSAEGCALYSRVTALGYAWGWAHHIPVGVQLSHFYVFTWLNIEYLPPSNSCLRLTIRDLCALSWDVQWFKIHSEPRSQGLHVSRGSGDHA